MPEIKVLISKETHAKLREAQRLAGISEQRMAVGALLEDWHLQCDSNELAPIMLRRMPRMGKVLLRRIRELAGEDHEAP